MSSSTGPSTSSTDDGRMNHVPSDPVQEGPAVWVVECSCGHRAEASHPNTAVGKHEQHVGVQQARTALRGGR